MIDWDEVLSAVAILRDAAAALDADLGTGTPEGVTLSELARLTLALDATASKVDHARGFVHALTAELMEDNDAVVPGVAYLTREWKKDRSKWDNDALLRDVLMSLQAEVPAHAVMPDTGERVHTWEQGVTQLTRAFNVTGYQARITQLQRLGLDPGDYCVEKPWRPKVTVTAIEEDPSDGPDPSTPGQRKRPRAR